MEKADCLYLLEIKYWILATKTGWSFIKCSIRHTRKRQLLFPNGFIQSICLVKSWNSKQLRCQDISADISNSLLINKIPFKSHFLYNWTLSLPEHKEEMDHSLLFSSAPHLGRQRGGNVFSEVAVYGVLLRVSFSRRRVLMHYRLMITATSVINSFPLIAKQLNTMLSILPQFLL